LRCWGSFAGTKGAIFVESSPGRGASFRVHLEAVAAPPASGGESEAPERGGGGIMLFVDGDESMRALAERAFRQFGFRWRMARNAGEALEVFEGCAEDVDVVVLDGAALEPDASEWVHRFRRRRSETAIIVASGRPEAETYER
jgi:PleD family two-component response regulator